MAEAKTNLSFDPEAYTTGKLLSAIKDKDSAREIRKEYSRLRAVAQKRLKRLEQAGGQFTQSRAYTYNVGQYPTLKGMTDVQIAYKLAELKKFITARSSTVSGQKSLARERIGKLHEHGYTFVNERNIFDFGDFMAEARELLGVKRGTEWDSEAVAEFYETVSSEGVDWRALFNVPISRGSTVEDVFNYWLEHKEATATAFNKIENTRGLTSAKLRKAIEQEERGRK